MSDECTLVNGEYMCELKVFSLSTDTKNILAGSLKKTEWKIPVSEKPRLASLSRDY